MKQFVFEKVGEKRGWMLGLCISLGLVRSERAGYQSFSCQVRVYVSKTSQDQRQVGI
jgi:hypothetical protein